MVPFCFFLVVLKTTVVYFGFRYLHKTDLLQQNKFYVYLKFMAAVIKAVQAYVKPLLFLSVEKFLLLT